MMITTPAKSRKTNSRGKKPRPLSSTRRKSRAPYSEWKDQMAFRFYFRKLQRLASNNRRGQASGREDSNGLKGIGEGQDADCSHPRDYKRPLPDHLGLVRKDRTRIYTSSEINNSQNETTEFRFAVPRVFECDECPKIFFHKILFRRHMIRHLKNRRRCPKCNKNFANKFLQKRHVSICGPEATEREMKKLVKKCDEILQRLRKVH